MVNNGHLDDGDVMMLVSIMDWWEKGEWVLQFGPVSVAEPPKCLGPPTPVIVLRTPDGGVGDPPTLEVRWTSLDAHSTATCGVPSRLVLTTGGG